MPVEVCKIYVARAGISNMGGVEHIAEAVAEIVRAEQAPMSPIPEAVSADDLEHAIEDMLRYETYRLGAHSLDSVYEDGLKRGGRWGVRWREQAASGAGGEDGDGAAMGGGDRVHGMDGGDSGAVDMGEPLTDPADRDAAYLAWAREYYRNSDVGRNWDDSKLMTGFDYDSWCAAWEARGRHIDAAP